MTRPSNTSRWPGALLALAGGALWIWALIRLVSPPDDASGQITYIGALHVGLVLVCVGVLLNKFGTADVRKLPWFVARRWEFKPKRRPTPRNPNRQNTR